MKDLGTQSKGSYKTQCKDGSKLIVLFGKLSLFQSPQILQPHKMRQVHR